MPFIHPAIFWTGLAAVAAPVLIHLLNRRRFRVREWAAMRFLLESMRRNRRRLRIEELILLALRCLVILLLAIGLARFVGCGAPGALGLGEEGGRANVFILDDSYSMAQKVGGATLFDKAVADLSERIGDLPAGDKLSILLASRGGGGDPLFAPAFVSEVDVESLTARLAGLKPSDGRADLPGALDKAGELLAGEPGSRLVHVFSDFRRADLAPDERATALREQYEALRADDVDLVAWDYGRGGRTNLTIESVELLDRLAAADVPIRVAVTVRNHGEVRAENVEVSLAVRAPDGATAELPPRVIESISPGEVGRVETTATFPSPGYGVLTARLAADELAPDNTAALSVEVRPALRVLVVDGRPSVADPTDSASYFYVAAIDPTGDGRYGIRPEVVPVDGLIGADLDRYDAVAMLNVPALPAQVSTDPDSPGMDYPALRALEEYVAGGGGLVIFSGERVNLSFYNGPFYAEGLGLCPHRIGAPAGDPDRRDRYFRIDPKSIAAEGMLRVFQGESAIMTGLIRFFAFTPADRRATAPASEQVGPPRTLAAFTDENRSPAIVMRRYGEGTSVMVYTTASTRWTDWPIDEMGTYVAVVNDMLSQIARRAERLTEPVGRPIGRELPASLRDAAATLRTPRYPETDLVPLPVRRAEDTAVVRYERTDEAGVYELTLRLPDETSEQIFLARNVDPEEGDLTPGGEEALAAAAGDDDFVYFAAFDADEGPRDPARGKEYWKYALLAVLALMAVEVVLAQRFGHYS